VREREKSKKKSSFFLLFALGVSAALWKSRASVCARRCLSLLTLCQHQCKRRACGKKKTLVRLNEKKKDDAEKKAKYARSHA